MLYWIWDSLSVEPSRNFASGLVVGFLAGHIFTLVLTIHRLTRRRFRSLPPLGLLLIAPILLYSFLPFPWSLTLGYTFGFILIVAFGFSTSELFFQFSQQHRAIELEER